MNVEQVRAQFPSLNRQHNDVPVVYFDGPAGSQVPKRVADAVAHCMVHINANTHGVFATAAETDALLEKAQLVASTFLGVAGDPVVFGANMTSLTFALSRSIARSWKPGDEILVTRLDHDANITPWVLAAQEAGAVVRHIEFKPDDCTLDMADFEAKLSDRTRFLAVGAASNAVGTINPVAHMVEQVHSRGGLVFVDAVHSAPHLLIDVPAWGCDFVACSAYKFFGPHVGMLWGRPGLMRELPAYQVRPADPDHPYRWMTGTQNHEGIAGVIDAIEYLAELAGATADLRGALVAGYAQIASHERKLLTALLDGLAALDKVTVAGITSLDRLDERVPTLSIAHADQSPQQLATYLAERGIFVWNGNYYAIDWSESLGLEPDGMVRIGLLHYNTIGEVERLLGALRELE